MSLNLVDEDDGRMLNHNWLTGQKLPYSCLALILMQKQPMSRKL